METILSVRVDDDLTRFITRQVDGGRYENPEAVLRAGLHLLAEREARSAALLAEIDEGEQSGISEQSVLEIWEDVKAESAGRPRA